MNGVIFDIKRFAVHDGPGIRVTVFLKGCPLSCCWCHNPESISSEICTVPKTVRIGDKTFTENEAVGYTISPEKLIGEFRKEQVFMDESGGGVTFSGGEPLMQPEFMAESLSLCKREKYHTAVDTSGFVAWDTFEKIIPYTDLFLYDLKLIDDELHKKYTGVSNKLVLENLSRLLKEKQNVRIRMPMIQGISFTRENIEQSISFLKNLPAAIAGVDLLPYHNIASHKYKRFNIADRLEIKESLPKDKLYEVKQQFEEAGFDTGIGG